MTTIIISLIFDGSRHIGPVCKCGEVCEVQIRRATCLWGAAWLEPYYVDGVTSCRCLIKEALVKRHWHFTAMVWVVGDGLARNEAARCCDKIGTMR